MQSDSRPRTPNPPERAQSGRPSGEDVTDLTAVLSRIERWGAARDWVGPDPYEGLTSPLGRRAPGRRGRQLVTQAYKRAPARPPWPLRAPARPNAKALALALSGYASLAGRALPGADEHLNGIPARVEQLAIRGEGVGWGYHFPVQTRGIRYDERTPNAIATCFVVGALCDAHAATGAPRCRELALSARPLLLSLLRRERTGPYFAYVPGQAPLIHNANVMVCGALARLHGLEPSDEASAAIRAALPTTLSRTRSDGLWDYGELPGYRWVDNFHTAYVLEGLLRVRGALELEIPQLDPGLAEWRRAFFEPDGWARYHAAEHYPLEAHCSASAIDLLCLTGSPEDLELARCVATCAVRELWLESEDRFAFRRTRRGLNRREFMRWTNAPMFRALAWLLSAGAA